MQLPLSSEFIEQAERFALRYCCEDCAYFDELAQVCAHAWPAAQHRRDYYRERRGALVFCKEFELR